MASDTFRPTWSGPFYCGHNPEPRVYGRTSEGRILCDTCCAALDVRALRETGKGAGCLTKGADGRARVSTWPGVPILEVLGRPTFYRQRGFWNAPIDRAAFRARDPETGELYHGRGSGFGMICTLRRMKGSR